MSLINKKVLGAGALVALSAFVPNPFLIGSDGPLHLGQALAQPTAKDTMNVTAKIINPLKVNQLTKVNFGSFAVGNTDATIKLNCTNAVAIVAGDAVAIGGHVNGKISFQAPKSAKFTISIADIDTKAVVLKTAGGTTDNKTMKLNQILMKAGTKMKIDSGNVCEVFSTGNHKFSKNLIIDAGGVATAVVGGQITDVDDTQVVGTYTGQYTVLTTF